jgi:hypothetical protein
MIFYDLRNLKILAPSIDVHEDMLTLPLNWSSRHRLDLSVQVARFIFEKMGIDVIGGLIGDQTNCWFTRSIRRPHSSTCSNSHMISHLVMDVEIARRRRRD